MSRKSQSCKDRYLRLPVEKKKKKDKYTVMIIVKVSIIDPEDSQGRNFDQIRSFLLLQLKVERG